MNREEAINFGEMWLELQEDSQGSDTYEFFKFAVEGLKQTAAEPMAEIDLYSLVKQTYIEREVLDKIVAEIEEQVLESLSDSGDDWFAAEKVNECLDIINKYKKDGE